MGFATIEVGLAIGGIVKGLVVVGLHMHVREHCKAQSLGLKQGKREKQKL